MDLYQIFFVVPLKTISKIVMENIVELLYCGDVQVSSANKTKVMTALELLEIEHLMGAAMPPKVLVNPTIAVNQPKTSTPNTMTSLQSKGDFLLKTSFPKIFKCDC